MFKFILKRTSDKLVKEAYIGGFNNGLGLGMTIGRYHAGDKGVIVSARVQEEVDKILQNKQRG